MFDIREIERSDLCKINAWHNDRELSSLLGGNYHFAGSEVDESWFEHYLGNREASVRCAIVEIDELGNEKVIGVVYLMDIDYVNRSGELHIMIGDKAERGKGAGTFAVNAMVAHAFNDLNLRRIQLEVLEENERAIRVYERTGFKVEGVKREAVFKGGLYRNIVLMAVLREDAPKLA